MITPERKDPHDTPPASTPEADADDRLDEALEETFPASDPIAVHLLSPAEQVAARRKGGTFT